MLCIKINLRARKQLVKTRERAWQFGGYPVMSPEEIPEFAIP